MLKLVRDHKNLVNYTKQLNFTESGTNHLVAGIKSFFDSLFVDGGYEQENPASVTPTAPKPATPTRK
jgi:hypothetical protein